jgi:hypothetical protein
MSAVAAMAHHIGNLSSNTTVHTAAMSRAQKMYLSI